MSGAGRASFAAELRRRRAEFGLSLAELAGSAHLHRGYLHHVEHGRRWPSGPVAAGLDVALGADGALLDAWRAGETAALPAADGGEPPDELLELAARAEASDIGPTTLDAVELAVEHLARAYATTPPGVLLDQVRRRSREITALLGGRATLAQRWRLLVAGGWLALLGATVHIDLGRRLDAHTARAVAVSLDRETGHGELGAWAVEIDAWEALVDQDWSRAVALAQAGEAVAPAGSSAAVQLAAQFARAAARLGEGASVRAALGRAAAALGRQRPGRPPDHHFAFDPRKLDGYTATALAWLGDPAGESQARAVVDHYAPDGPTRRLATARLDLGLILARERRPDEAAHLGVLAVGSDRLVPSNIWRAAELDDALAGHRDVPEVADLHELCAGHDQPGL